VPLVFAALLGFLLMLVATACGEPKPSGPEASLEQPMDKETVEALKQVAGERVFFGHQSVGGNILGGLESLLAASGTNWAVVDITAGQAPGGPALLHARIGENGTPTGKIDDFGRAIAKMTPAKPKFAFMKLCYVDVRSDADVAKLLDYYTKALTKLKSEHPDTTFGHVTVPLAPVLNRLQESRQAVHWRASQKGRRQRTTRRVQRAAAQGLPR